MQHRVPERPVSGPGRMPDTESGCPGSQIIGGLFVPVLEVDDARYLPGDVIDDRWAHDPFPIPRAFVPHSTAAAGPRLAAEGPAATTHGRPAPGPDASDVSGPGVTPGGAR